MTISHRRETSQLSGFGRQKTAFHTLTMAEIKRQLCSCSGFDLGREVVLKSQLALQSSDRRLWLRVIAKMADSRVREAEAWNWQEASVIHHLELLFLIKRYF